MFCNKPKSVNKTVPTQRKKNRKRKKKFTQPEGEKKTRNFQQGGLNLPIAMSTWAQNYTAAATWQLKHQVAYWKSRAVALQYENKILHDMIREDHFKQSENSSTKSSQSLYSTTKGPQIASESSESSESEEETDEEVDDENEDLEVSEEWIEFLKQNAKYKEGARKEREELKAKCEAESQQNLEEEQRSETSEERQARLIELYGDSWEEILALETSILCNFINECDKERPKYWPNIPFNFSSC